MNPEPSHDTSRAIAIVREYIAGWRPDTFSQACDGPPSAQIDPDSYFVEWEMRLTPASPTACPLELWFAAGCCPDPACVGFGFDSQESLAARLNLKSQNSALSSAWSP